jgi:predicted aldo/keto reductase-like oxidoreductase
VAIPIPRYLGLYNDVKQFGTTYFSTQSFIYKSYSQKNGVGKASDCTECEACVENCPQHLDIPTFMGDVREMFE